MDWRDEGILLSVRRHGENSAIIEALTIRHGRHAGLVRGGGSKSLAAVLQPGAQLSLEWKARLADHLGTYKVDLVRSRAGAILASRDMLAALNVISAFLVQFLPEREPQEELYAQSLGLLDCMASGDARWPVEYARWELSLLGALGFGLDLRACAQTGLSMDLAYVSPRSGRAVSRSAGGPFADKLLPLPGFLIGEGEATIGDVREALRMIGYFLEHWACEAYGMEELPPTRVRLLRLLEIYEMPAATSEEEWNADELEWLEQWDSEDMLKLPSR